MIKVYNCTCSPGKGKTWGELQQMTLTSLRYVHIVVILNIVIIVIIINMTMWTTADDTCITEVVNRHHYHHHKYCCHCCQHCLNSLTLVNHGQDIPVQANTETPCRLPAVLPFASSCLPGILMMDTDAKSNLNSTDAKLAPQKLAPN